MTDSIKQPPAEPKSAQVENKPLVSRRRWMIAAVALSGILVSLLVLRVLRSKEESQIKEEFRLRSADRMKSIVSEFESGKMLLRSLAAYMQLSSDVTETQFSAMADSLLSEHSTMQALSWNRRVSANELAAYRNARLADYEIRQMRPDGALEPIDGRSHDLSDGRDLFVVEMIEPLEPNRSALGLDIASEPIRRSALYRACETGTSVASGRIRLVQETGSQFGTLVITPVRRNAGLESEVAGRSRVAGVVVGAYRIGDAVQAAMEKLEPVGIDIVLYDESAPPEEQLLHRHCSRLRENPSEFSEDPRRLQTYVESSHFEIGGRQWALYCTPTNDFLVSRRTWLPLTAFGGGLFVTLLIAAYLYGQGRVTDQLRREIVVRAEAERHLQESERRFRSLCETLPVGIFVNDKQGNQVFANKVCRELTELTSREAIERGWAQSIHPDDRERVMKDLMTAVQRDADVEMETRLQANGTTSWVHLLAVARRDERGEFIGYMGSLIDITKRKQAEAELRLARDELRTSEAKYRRIVETTQEWIWEIDREGIHTFSNRAVQDILGYTTDEIVGKSSLALIHDEDRAEAQKRLPVLIGRDDGWTGWIIRWRHKDGGIRYLESNAVPILDGQGMHIGYRGADRDITARVEAERQIAEQQRSLTHISRLSTMGEMVAGIAHEINQPLSAISNYSAAAANVVKTRNHDQTGLIDEWLKQIGLQAVRCGDIIRRLRHFVTKDKEEFQTVSLNDVVCDSVALIASDQRQSARGIECCLPAASPQVYGNEVQLQQVLVNLLRNALDSTLDAKTPEIRVSIELLDDRAVLTVEDNGSGVQARQQARVFDAFFTTKSDGLGMGLAISKSIVEAHHGRMWLDSETGRGAHFHIELPVPKAG